jgi:hypothetical protein
MTDENTQHEIDESQLTQEQREWLAQHDALERRRLRIQKEEIQKATVEKQLNEIGEMSNKEFEKFRRKNYGF